MKCHATEGLGVQTSQYRDSHWSCPALPAELNSSTSLFTAVSSFLRYWTPTVCPFWLRGFLVFLTGDSSFSWLPLGTCSENPHQHGTKSTRSELPVTSSWLTWRQTATWPFHGTLKSPLGLSSKALRHRATSTAGCWHRGYAGAENSGLSRGFTVLIFTLCLGNATDASSVLTCPPSSSFELPKGRNCSHPGTTAWLRDYKRRTVLTSECVTQLYRWVFTCQLYFANFLPRGDKFLLPSQPRLRHFT